MNSPVLMALAAGLEAQFIAPPSSLNAGAIIAVLIAILGTLLTLRPLIPSHPFPPLRVILSNHL